VARPPIHPGEVLAGELDEIQMTTAHLSQELGIPADHLGQILSDSRDLGADFAFRLGDWFGAGPEIWRDLQQSYESRLAEQKQGVDDSL
jgi:addiction module HigA family antidote